MEGEGARERWEFFNNTLWKHKNSSCALRVREVDGARDPLSLAASFRLCTKPKEKHTRDGKVDKYLLRATRALPGHAHTCS